MLFSRASQRYPDGVSIDAADAMQIIAVLYDWPKGLVDMASCFGVCDAHVDHEGKVFVHDPESTSPIRELLVFCSVFVRHRAE